MGEHNRNNRCLDFSLHQTGHSKRHNVPYGYPLRPDGLYGQISQVNQRQAYQNAYKIERIAVGLKIRQAVCNIRAELIINKFVRFK